MPLKKTYTDSTKVSSLSDGKLTLVFVDDRPATLSNAVFARDDINLVLLRSKNHGFSEEYLARTAHIDAYYRDIEQPEATQIDNFKQWCADRGVKPSRLLNPSEPEQSFSHALAREVGIPALSEDQVSWLRNKARMKDKFREIGFSTAEYKEIKCTSEIIEFGNTYGWPVVLKPQEGFACIDTYLIGSEEDATNHDLGPDEKWMVESYIQGQEWECCALIQNGRVLDSYISYMPARPLDIVDGAINVNVSLAPKPESFPIDTNDLVQRIVDGMELDHGYMHMEFFIDEQNTLFMGEAALRLAGCEIPANHGYANGFDIFNTLIDIHLGIKANPVYTNEKCVGDLLLPAKPGFITNMTSEKELLNQPGVLEYKPRQKIGDFSDPRRASHTCSAVVHVEGENLEEVLARMETIISFYRIETRPGVTKENDHFGLDI